MSDECYNGWTNRETWAVALHINNDQGWQESVLEDLRELVEEIPANSGEDDNPYWESRAGEIIRENVESTLEPIEESSNTVTFTRGQWLALQDIGDLARVDWTELGWSFLEELDS